MNTDSAVAAYDGPRKAQVERVEAAYRSIVGLADSEMDALISIASAAVVWTNLRREPLASQTIVAAILADRARASQPPTREQIAKAIRESDVYDPEKNSVQSYNDAADAVLDLYARRDPRPKPRFGHCSLGPHPEGTTCNGTPGETCPVYARVVRAEQPCPNKGCVLPAGHLSFHSDGCTCNHTVDEMEAAAKPWHRHGCPVLKSGDE